MQDSVLNSKNSLDLIKCIRKYTVCIYYLGINITFLRRLLYLRPSKSYKTENFNNSLNSKTVHDVRKLNGTGENWGLCYDAVCNLVGDKYFNIIRSCNPDDYKRNSADALELLYFLPVILPFCPITTEKVWKRLIQHCAGQIHSPW
jgi:hypothetical protein